MTFVKICGLRTPEAVQAAVTGGADAVGFVFAPGSPRTVDAATAAALVALVPAGVETVGVFRNQPVDEVIATAAAAGVATVQLHGAESAADLQRLADAGFGTLRAMSAVQYTAHAHELPPGQRLLVDAVRPGSGTAFDPSELPAPPTGFWLLAGGLNPGNVAAMIARYGASGADVSSGVETAPGVKSTDLIEQFLRAARV